MQILVRPSTDGLVLQILVRVLFTHTHYYSVFQEFNLELGYMQMIVRDHAVLTHNDPPIGLASSNTLITTLLLLLVHTQSPTHSISIIGMDIAIALHCIGMDIGPCSVRSQSPTHCIFLHLDHFYYRRSLAETQREGASSANIFSSHIIINIFSSHIIITRVPSFTHNNYPVTKLHKSQFCNCSLLLFPLHEFPTRF